MSIKEKLFQRLKNNPNNVKFDELRTMLEQQGFALERIAGSHWYLQDGIYKSKGTTFVVPKHNQNVKAMLCQASNSDN
jgi:predicted RNA binding protein YcfA (HicA-like mRNA interferase family)